MGDECGDGDCHAYDGSAERFGNAHGDAVRIALRRAFAEGAEDLHESAHCTEEAEQRGDADDDFEDVQAVFELADFVACDGLDGVHVFVLGLVQIGEADLRDAGKCGVVVAHQAGKADDCVGRVVGREALDFLLQFIRDYEVAAQREAAQKNHRHGDDGAREQRDHEDAALVKELVDVLERCSE